MAGKAAFATKIPGFQERNHRFLPLGGNDAELHLSVLDKKDGVRCSALGKDDLPLAISRDRHAAINVPGSNGFCACRLLMGAPVCLPK